MCIISFKMLLSYNLKEIYNHNKISIKENRKKSIRNNAELLG